MLILERNKCFVRDRLSSCQMLRNCLSLCFVLFVCLLVCLLVYLFFPVLFFHLLALMYIKNFTQSL